MAALLWLAASCCWLQAENGLESQQKTRQLNNYAMTITKNLGMLLLAIYLIIVGLIGTFGFSLGQLSILVPILAITAGVFILIGK